ncbi:amino acid ABC transporter permease, partial [Halorubrum sp. SS5]
MSVPGSLALAASASLASLGAPDPTASGALLSVAESIDWWLVGDPADWWFVVRNADYLGGGLLLTVGLTVASILLGFLVGFPAGAVEVYGDGLSKRLVETAGVVLRGTPIVVILLVMYFVLGVPQVNLG